MIKFKNCAIFFICIFSVFLISINIFILFSNNKLRDDAKNLISVKNNISSLDEFEEIILNIEHSQKFYILSQNKKYKKDYNDYLSKAYTYLDKFYDTNCIDSETKENLEKMLKEYDDINLKLLNSEINLPLNSEIKNYLIESNNIQIDMIDTLSDTILGTKNSVSKNNVSLTESIDSQKNFIQALSSITTVVIGGPLCYVFKKCRNGTISLSGITNIITNQKTKLETYSNWFLLSSILNDHNKEMIERLSEVCIKIQNLEKAIESLEEEIQKCSILSSKIGSLKIKVLEIKFMTQDLPYYHQFIVTLTDNIIQNEQNNKK
ncbi:hypothetical protein [Clostridium sp. BJN0001]|uniref:CHASE3 domain-containing protein n=1 Tax=Clostridium sp. BJN0001 TaxID=2930219 RepID=UPI001FD5D48E|nr:hypothetical protein [Clostridium sp. BJN0001]